MVWQFAELFTGVPTEEMRGSLFTVTRFFTMANLALLFPCAISSSAVFIHVVNFAGKGLSPSYTFIQYLIPCKPDSSKSLLYHQNILIDSKRFFSVIKGMQGSKSLEFQWSWLLNCPSKSLFSVLSAARQLGVGVFIKLLSKSCFFKGLSIRTFSSPVTWFYQCLRGIVRITPRQKLLVLLLIKWY